MGFCTGGGAKQIAGGARRAQETSCRIRLGLTHLAHTGPADRTISPSLEAMNGFIRWLIPAIEKFPKSQKFLLGDRIQSTALDVLERLIEATYSKPRQTHLQSANLGIEKLRHMFRIASDLHYLDLNRCEFAARALDEVGRLIGGWAKRDRAPA